MLKKIGLIAGVVFVVGIGFLLMPSKGSYSDCILENMPKAQTKAAAIYLQGACREKYPVDTSGIDFTGVNFAAGEKSIPKPPPGFVLDKKPKLKKVKCDPFKEALKGTSAEGKGSRGELPACEGT